MAEYSPAAEKWILEAKRRAAERLGIPFDPDAEDSAPAPVEPAPAQPEPVAAAPPPAASAPEPKAAETVAPAVAEAEQASPPPAPEPAVPAAPPAPAPQPARRPAPAAAPVPETEGDAKYAYTDWRKLNRREFLSYSWGAAVGVVTAQSLVATGLLMYPRFKAGEFGGDFLLGSATGLPAPDAAPQGDPVGKFWLVNTENGPRALYMVCTHLGCLYKWVEANRRFECPCHGSKFTREGVFIEGPAPRSLDQFVVELVENGSVVGSTQNTDEGIQPPALPSDEVEIIVKTGRRIQGPSSF